MKKTCHASQTKLTRLEQVCSLFGKTAAARQSGWLGAMGLDHLCARRHSGHCRIYTGQFFGHLQLVHGLTAYPDHGLVIDVALHAGTLLAVMSYFYRDVGLMLVGGRNIIRRRPSASAHLVRVLVIASLPVLLAGAVLVALGVTDALRKPEIVAWASIVFAIPLWLADRRHATRSSDIKASEGGDVQTISPRHALIIGLAQMLALIPGASRAGVTIMAGLYLGFDRTQAARFSMLLAMPVIGAFALVDLVDLVQAGALRLWARRWSQACWRRSSPLRPFMCF